MAEISRLPRPVASEWEWQFQGACQELPTEVCASCPVIEACRKHALAVQEPYGIWGGLSEDDREAIIEQSEISPRRRLALTPAS